MDWFRIIILTVTEVFGCNYIFDYIALNIWQRMAVRWNFFPDFSADVRDDYGEEYHMDAES